MEERVKYRVEEGWRPWDLTTGEVLSDRFRRGAEMQIMGFGVRIGALTRIVVGK